MPRLFQCDPTFGQRFFNYPAQTLRCNRLDDVIVGPILDVIHSYAQVVHRGDKDDGHVWVNLFYVLIQA